MEKTNTCSESFFSKLEKIAMKFIFFQVLITLLPGFVFSQQKSSASPHPNIIIFLVDDMGWQDCSVPFYKEKTKWNSIYHTPNLEKLAATGMKFTNAYAAPVCTPTRVSLLTGMNAVNHKVTNWTLNKNKSSDGESAILNPPQWNVNGFSPVAGIENTIHATGFPAILKQNGYFTIHIGKAHFGAMNTPGEDPLNIGFDMNVAGYAAGAAGSYFGVDSFGNKKGKSNVWAVPGLEKYWGKDIFLSEALTQEAIAGMEQALQSNKPFLLYMAHYAIHAPIMGDKRFVQKYFDAGLDTIEAKYASLIEGMDKSLGDIMNFLQEKNIDKNTLIIFLSDNGGLSAQARGGTPNTHNLPLRSGKGSAYEGGIRIPFIVRWPGITKNNTSNSNNIIVEDIFPTVLLMAGVKKTSLVQTINGKSILPYLKQTVTDNKRYLYWHYPHVWGPEGPGLKMYSVIRQGYWKLIYFYENQAFELYNTRDDIGEQKNLLHTHFNIAKKLAIQLGSYLRKSNAGIPIDKKTGKVVLYPDEVKEMVALPATIKK